MKKSIFYLLSFTWGIVLTIIGLAVAGVLLIARKKPKRWGHCWYFEVGKSWGGLELGPIFLTSKNPSRRTKNHEHGHAIQNCYWGPLFILVIWIPSALRYHYRNLRDKLKLYNKTDYDAIWFEGQATNIGNNLYFSNINLFKD